MLDKQDLIDFRGVVREEVTEKFGLLDKRMDSFDKRMDGLDKRMDGVEISLGGRIDQMGVDIAEMIEESILPQIDRLSEKLDTFSANFVRKSELNIVMDDFRREMKEKRRSKR